jgi:hypothetical protein
VPFDTLILDFYPTAKLFHIDFQIEGMVTAAFAIFNDFFGVE